MAVLGVHADLIGPEDVSQRGDGWLPRFEPEADLGKAPARQPHEPGIICDDLSRGGEPGLLPAGNDCAGGRVRERAVSGSLEQTGKLIHPDGVLLTHEAQDCQVSFCDLDRALI